LSESSSRWGSRGSSISAVVRLVALVERVLPSSVSMSVGTSALFSRSNGCHCLIDGRC
jgi:hypothetical protein